jgi:putative N6-adenine-specific DNA methylase
MENKADSFRMIAKTISGLEDVLAHELEELGAEQVRTVNRGAAFFGDKKLLYKANYCCRTALRILQPIAVFEAGNEQELYDGIGRIDWSEYLDVSGTFAVSGVTTYSNITHSKYLALKTKDAIADQFREKFGKRPNVKLDNPDLAINVRIFRNECTVSIDSSGDSLHKRGYRVATGPAPISEVLAAGMVLLSGWDGTTNFIDPMCGSGTIPIEAGLIACHIPPGSFREEYSFKHWNNFDLQLWEAVRSEAMAKHKNDIPGKIIGTDWSGRVLQTARENVRSAGLEQVIKLGVDFMHDTIPPEGGGIMITNPPYGERIKPHDIEKLYSEIGDSLKKNFSGYSAWVISSHKEAMKHVGLRPSRNLTVFNGQLECRLSCFEMYEGSKKDQYRPDNKDHTPQRTFRKTDQKPSGRNFEKPKRDFQKREKNFKDKNRNEKSGDRNRQAGNKGNRGNRNTNRLK